MANYRTSGYQYETSPKKLEPEYRPEKNPYSKKKSGALKNKDVNQKEKPRNQVKERLKLVINIAIIFSALFVISYRNSKINESFNKNAGLKQSLAVTQKENEQLQVNIENSLNLSNIEKIAKEKLGMQKLDNSQKVYVSLPKKDYIEPAVEKVTIEENQNIFQKILNIFMGN